MSRSRILATAWPGIVNHRDWTKVPVLDHEARGGGSPDAGDERDPRGDGGATAERRGVRRRLAEVAAAQRARGDARGGRERDERAPDVRARHRAAERPPRDLRRLRRACCDRRGASAIRADDGDVGRDGSRESRSADRVRAPGCRTRSTSRSSRRSPRAARRRRGSRRCRRRRSTRSWVLPARSRPRIRICTSRSSGSTTTAPSRSRRCCTRSSDCVRSCAPAISTDSAR